MAIVCDTLHISKTEYYQAMTAWAWLKEDHAGGGSQNASPVAVFRVRFPRGKTKTRGLKKKTEQCETGSKPNGKA
jgi:hypothetical protein